MTQPADHPAWLDAACSELGLHETPGAAIDPAVRALFRDAGHPEVDSSDVAWCAAFVGACLTRSGIPPTLSLLARSYLDWGVPLDAPKLGAIVVLSRDPDPTQGHVGLYLGETSTSLLLLGGNQHNAVSVAAFPKSRLLGLRWPSVERVAVTPPPAGAPAAVPDPLFEQALAHVLEMEGGYTDDPADPGGPTNLGITLSDYARFRKIAIDPASIDQLVTDLKRIAPDVVRSIYLDTYWTPAGSPGLPPPIAYFHFDTAVNMGTGTASRMLQTALGCLVDGECGPVTFAAAAAAQPSQLLSAYADLRRRRYRSLATFPRFGRGWLARVDTTLSRALALDPSRSKTQGKPAMTSDQANAAAPFSTDPKWWGDSQTIWGAIVTGLAAVVPVLGPAIGVTISADTVHLGADQMTAIVQAVIGLAGTIATIRGRIRATQPLTQRMITVKI